jgi:RNA polymerase sigma factor (sigma-70 family)
MPENCEFQELISKIRAGDQDAAAELIQTYESEIRRIARCRLTDPNLRRVLDSMDICQSVLANFFVRAGVGQFEIETPEKLLTLLVTMANNKIRDRARQLKAKRRDQRRNVTQGMEAMRGVANGDATASRIVAGKELLEKVQQHLSDEERFLAEQRAQGRPWAELAVELGTSAEALRKQFSRAIDRVARKLGLYELLET